MCHNNPPPPPPPSDLTHSNSILKTQKQPADSLSLTAPRRKSRTKIKKPKFLSLRLQLFPTHHKPSSPSLSQSNPMNHQQQLNLFPLHPENIVDDKDDMQDEHNVAFLFVSDGAATLNGLLEEDSTTTTTTSEEPCLGSPFDEENGSSLVRKAMKRRNKEERDGREERWVCYSEVVRKKEMMEEVTSDCSASETTTFGLLSLKLDYEGILNAWSDKGSLYVAGEAPQTVPDLRDGVLPHNAADVVWKAWEVEEEGGSNSKSKMKGKEEIGCKVGQREASVLRYKEKRQSRLFSKRIRYEVRKLNAEKRPRMKGRFVKRD